jgi:hypothetical protein
VGAWKNGGVQQRQELAWSLYPEGLRFSRETLFLEPGKVLLMNAMREMIDDLVAGKNIGVPLVQILNHLARLRALVKRLWIEDQIECSTA